MPAPAQLSATSPRLLSFLNSSTSAKPIQLGLLGFLLLGLLLLKLTFNPYPIGDHGLDGSFYYQIARHVSEGNGLQTSVSLYHQGLKNLPQPSTIYPLWPLVLGGGGALIGLELAASILPEILFLCSLLLLYFLSNAISHYLAPDRNLFSKSHSWLTLGHWAVLLLGLNQSFFCFTSFPYTEGLAFTLTFSALLALTKLAEGPSLVWGIIAGTLASLAYLTRSQMFGTSVAICITLGLISIKNPSYRRTTLATYMAIGFPIVVWIIYLQSITHQFSPRILIDFAAYHETSELLPFRYLVTTHSIGDLLWDRARSLIVAFDLTSGYSYVNSFGVSAYLPIVALFLILLRPQHIFQTLRTSLTPKAIPIIATLFTSLICLLPVHAFHADYHFPYLFHFRHGLPIVFLILIAAGFLLIQKNAFLQKLCLLLMTLSLATNAWAIDRTMGWGNKYQGPQPSEQEVADWIAQQDPQPLFATTRPWAWGAYTHGRFHWVSCEEPREQMLAYLNHIQIDHLLTQGEEEKCSFFTSISEYLSPIQQFNDGGPTITVWQVQKENLDQDSIDTQVKLLESADPSF